MWKSCADRFRRSLTARIFLLTALMLAAACAVTYVFLSWATPLSYSAMAGDELTARATELGAELKQVTVADSEPLLTRFIAGTGASIRIADENGESAVSFAVEGTGDLGWGSGFKSSDRSEVYTEVTMGTAEAEPADDAEAEVADDAEASAPSVDAVEGTGSMFSIEDNGVVTSVTVSDNTLTFPISFADKESCTLTVIPSTVAVNQAVEAMGRVLPYLAVVVLLIALLGAFVYSRYITRPIVRLSGISQKLAELDFTWQCDEKRTDEIGVLAESLNRLSTGLSAALNELRTANAALRRDMDRERELERQRTTFFSAASHELKTPITVLQGQLSGMLAEVDVYRDRDKYLARSLAVTNRMQALVREILAVSRMENADFALKREPIDLSALAAEQIGQLTELARQRGQTIVTDLAPGLWVAGDGVLLERAAANLLSNALMHSSTGAAVTVHLTVEAGSAVLTVVNTGVQIPDEALPHLFEAFYRADPSRSRETGGSGLGLYLVKLIADRHGGACGLRNLDGGVEAALRLPLHENSI